MAEVAVNSIIDKLTPLLTREVDLLRGVYKQVEDIRDELRSIKSFLRDADSRAEKEDAEESLKTWVTQAKELAFRIEDVIDEYVMHIARREDQRSCKAFLRKIILSIKKLKQRHDIASEIQDIKASVCQIKERSDRWQFNSSESRWSKGSGLHDPRIGALFIDETELVGIESSKEELASKLVQGESTRTVIALVGMGGLGKTTLIKKVYDDRRVQAQFNYRAWITVSQTYDIEQLLRSITRQFYETMKKNPSEIDAMDAMSLVNRLRQILKPSKYVVVFDDVWKENFWEEIEWAFLDNNNGSRIIITTRIADVANFCRKSALLYIHYSQPLPPDMAKELFFKRAFRFVQDNTCPKELEGLSSDIVERCKGLPLAIVAVGGLLSTKGVDVFEWQHLLDNLRLELKRNPHLTRIERILNLSYHDLPFHLKSCLLYIGMFPEDFSISCWRLRRLWIANGFIKEMEGYTALEAVSERYLAELINRSLIQVDKVKFNGKVKTCQVHDMLREVLITKSKELSFKQVSIENLSHLNGIARHLSIYNASRSNISKKSDIFQTRSLIFFEAYKLQYIETKSLFINFKLLNVLDFENAPLAQVPEELGNLLHVSYLSLRKTNVKELPKSIAKLHNLETLDLRQSQVTELPVDINRFPKLQYLFAYSTDYNVSFCFNTARGVKIQGNVGCLEALQKIYSLDAEHVSMNWIRDLGKLKQLRRLGIRELKREKSTALCEALEKMTRLESLSVTSTSEEEFLQLEPISSSVAFPLQSLRLRGRLEKLPSWIPKLKNLIKIRLFWSRLMEDPLKMLQTSPNLLQLYLHGAYNGEQLHFEEGCFPKLKRLTVGCMSGLKKVIIEEGALVSLEELEIGSTPRLKEVPHGIQLLKNLKRLYFYDMSREFALRVVPNQAPDRFIVDHVPSIYFAFTTHGLYNHYYKLGEADVLEFLQM